MKENKLGTYLLSFTEEDWRAYRNFSKSLYTESSDYQLVINFIKKHKSRFDPSYMDIEYLRKKIRPSAKKQVFTNVISTLCKHIEKYFAWAEVEKDPMMEDTLLLQALGKRGLTKQFYQQKEKSKTNRDELPIGLWNEYHEFMAEYLLYYCNMTSEVNTGKETLEKTLLNLKNFSNTIKGYLGVEMHNRTTILNEDWSNVISNLNIMSLKRKELSTTFSHLMNLKEYKEITSFNLLKKELFKTNLSKDLRHTILIYLTSFINNQKVRGNIKDGKEILKLYQYGLEKDLLFPNGLIPLIRYINIIGVACDVNEYNWAINFVNTYSKLVVSTNINEIKILGLAQIEFSKSNFEKVIENLRPIKFRQFDVETRVRWLLLSSIYETNKNDPNLIDYYVQSFHNFLKRNRLKTTKLKISGLKNSASYLSIIARGKHPIRTLEKIRSDKSLYYRKWLVDKISEKINNKKGAIQ